MAGRLDGRVALVTGGTRGIGEAIAASFAREGATVIVVSRKAPNVEEAVERLRETTGGDVHGTTMHVGQPDAVEQTVDEIVRTHGLVDILVNNAATNPYFGPMMGMEWSAWAKTIEVNLAGTWACTRAVARHLLDAEAPGSIINVSSIYGSIAAPMQGVYAITKAGILSMTRTLSVELGPARIRVNAIAQDLVDTRFAATLTQTPELRRMFEERSAWGEIAQPADIAGAALFLASDDSGFVTGATLPVDAGYGVR